MMRDPILCYVDGGWCYFTTQPLGEQWGDDWNDAPYEHNAGDPYTYSKYDEGRGRAPWTITKVAIDAALSTPADSANGGNSGYSVEMINAKAIPWLRTDEWHSGAPVAIFAGTPLPELIRIVQGMGGRVFVELAANV